MNWCNFPPPLQPSIWVILMQHGYIGCILLQHVGRDLIDVVVIPDFIASLQAYNYTHAGLNVADTWYHHRQCYNCK